MPTIVMSALSSTFERNDWGVATPTDGLTAFHQFPWKAMLTQLETALKDDRPDNDCPPELRFESDRGAVLSISIVGPDTWEMYGKLPFAEEKGLFRLLMTSLFCAIYGTSAESLYTSGVTRRAVKEAVTLFFHGQTTALRKRFRDGFS